MSQVVSTIFFNGQFWIALIEKFEDDGTFYVGRYTFGPEPNNTDLLDFYLNKYQTIRFYKSGQEPRNRKMHSEKELERNRSKSFAEFRIQQKKYLTENKKRIRQQNQESLEEKYLLKVKKKKQKKRGH